MPPPPATPGGCRPPTSAPPGRKYLLLENAYDQPVSVQVRVLPVGG